jgi:hypothetical protein
MRSRKRQRAVIRQPCAVMSCTEQGPQGDCARADKRSPLAEGVNEALPALSLRSPGRVPGLPRSILAREIRGSSHPCGPFRGQRSRSSFQRPESSLRLGLTRRGRGVRRTGPSTTRRGRIERESEPAACSLGCPLSGTALGGRFGPGRFTIRRAIQCRAPSAPLAATLLKVERAMSPRWLRMPASPRQRSPTRKERVRPTKRRDVRPAAFCHEREPGAGSQVGRLARKPTPLDGRSTCPPETLPRGPFCCLLAILDAHI